MRSFVKFLAIGVGVVGAIAIALLTGFFGILEILILWPLMLTLALVLDLSLNRLEPMKDEALFQEARESLRRPFIFSGRIGQFIFIEWIWWLTYHTSGSRVIVRSGKCDKRLPDTSVLVIGPHPTMEAATALSRELMSHFYGPVRWAIKWELMLWFAPVILPFLAAGAGYPLVRGSRVLSRCVLRWLGAIRTGVVAIFLDGTRPAEKKGHAARQWLREHGQAKAADQWDLPLALPRPGGVATLLAANPTARVVLAVTSGGVPGQSVIADFWSLVFGPETVYKVCLIDLDRAALDEATAQGDAVLGPLLVQIWLEKVLPLLRKGGMRPMRAEE